jgi:hypothetical protein
MNPEQKEQRARFRQEVRARITLIASERGLPKSEIAKVMSYLRTRDVIAFLKRHDISADWLLCGDLKGCSERFAVGGASRHEAPAQIDEKAQAAATGESGQAAAAVKTWARRCEPAGRFPEFAQCLAMISGSILWVISWMDIGIQVMTWAGLLTLVGLFASACASSGHYTSPSATRLARHGRRTSMSHPQVESPRMLHR